VIMSPTLLRAAAQKKDEKQNRNWYPEEPQ
jgi:hypothetical protein